LSIRGEIAAKASRTVGLFRASFAKAIDKLLDPKIRHEFEIGSKLQQDKFSMEIHVKDVISLINSTIKINSDQG